MNTVLLPLGACTTTEATLSGNQIKLPKNFVPKKFQGHVIVTLLPKDQKPTSTPRGTRPNGHLPDYVIQAGGRMSHKFSESFWRDYHETNHLAKEGKLPTAKSLKEVLNKNFQFKKKTRNASI